MDDKITFKMEFSISRGLVPVFLGFINKIFQNFKLKKSSLIAFYADGENEKFNFDAKTLDLNEKFMRNFGYKNYAGDIIVDREKAIAKPVCKNIETPGLCYNEIEEIYDAI